MSVAHDMSGESVPFLGVWMRRTEALQGVRMIKLRSVLDRYEASELICLEAAELGNGGRGRCGAGGVGLRRMERLVWRIVVWGKCRAGRFRPR